MPISTTSCTDCHLNYFKVIAEFYEQEEKAINFFREHSVLPSSVNCKICKTPCVFREEQQIWRCRNTLHTPKKSKRIRTRCTFSAADTKGTFISSSIPKWKILLFINHFVSHLWDHKTVVTCLDISYKSSIDWRSFCSEVCQYWFQNQEQIGGEGVEVEIDETQFVRRKYERGRAVRDIWLFGGIERVAKKRFVVALIGDVGERRDKTTLQGLIKKFIKPKSVIYSDAWGAYRGLEDIEGCGYVHRVINHSENFVDPVDPQIHTQNIERLWRDIKEWAKRPGIRSQYLGQYLARYLFVTSVSDQGLLHRFLKEAARVYPPQGEGQGHPEGLLFPTDPVTEENISEEVYDAAE